MRMDETSRVVEKSLDIEYVSRARGYRLDVYLWLLLQFSIISGWFLNNQPAKSSTNRLQLFLTLMVSSLS
jgi:hypothetical protein